MSQWRVSSSGCNKNTRRCNLFNHISVLYKRCVREDTSGVMYDPYKIQTERPDWREDNWDSAGRNSCSRPEGKDGGSKGRRGVGARGSDRHHRQLILSPLDCSKFSSSGPGGNNNRRGSMQMSPFAQKGFISETRITLELQFILPIDSFITKRRRFNVIL